MNNKNNKQNVCIICGSHADDGIIINGDLICKNCEKKILALNPSNNDYNEYVEKIKIIYK